MNRATRARGTVLGGEPAINFYIAVWNQITALSAYEGCGASASGDPLKLKVEILRLNGAAPEVLHSFRHRSSSIAAVQESMKGVTRSPAWPREANAFRIVSEDGEELYRWPNVTEISRLY
jgi:hypothetical protein